MVLPDLKRQINIGVFIDHRAAVALNRISVIDKLLQVTPYRLLRYLVELAQFTHYHAAFCL